MLNCAYALYSALLKCYPPKQDDTASEAAKRLEAVKDKLGKIPGLSGEDLFELEDCLDILSRLRAEHAFLLGLDAGLCLEKELEPFRQI